MCNEYNGWSNYPTWNTKLWLDNEQWLQEECQTIAARNSESAIGTGEAICVMLEELMPPAPETGMQADIWQWAWGQVDWREIGQAFIDDLEPEEDEHDPDDHECEYLGSGMWSCGHCDQS